MGRSRSPSALKIGKSESRGAAPFQPQEPSSSGATIWSTSTQRHALCRAPLLATISDAASQIAHLTALAIAALALCCWLLEPKWLDTVVSSPARSVAALAAAAACWPSAASCDRATLERAAGLLMAWVQLWLHDPAFRRAALWERRLACEFFAGRRVVAAEAALLWGDGPYAAARMLAGGEAQALLEEGSAWRWAERPTLRVVVVGPTAARFGSDCALDGGKCEQRRYDLARIYDSPELREKHGATQYLSAPALVMEQGSAALLALLLKAPDIGVDPRALALASRASVDACTQCWVEARLLNVVFGLTNSN